MATRKSKPKRKTGSAAMAAAGMKKVELWFDPTEYATVRQAARAAYRPLATWIRKLAFEAALDLIARTPSNVDLARRAREELGEFSGPVGREGMRAGGEED